MKDSFVRFDGEDAPKLPLLVLCCCCIFCICPHIFNGGHSLHNDEFGIILRLKVRDDLPCNY